MYTGLAEVPEPLPIFYYQVGLKKNNTIYKEIQIIVYNR